jgi:hypothetical protein
LKIEQAISLPGNSRLHQTAFSAKDVIGAASVLPYELFDYLHQKNRIQPNCTAIESVSLILKI